MKKRRIVAALVLAGLLACLMPAHAASLERAWMVYEDYSGNRVEQSIENAKTLKSLEQIMNRAKKNSAKLEDCTVNCTLFCMSGGEIYDFACATDGCPYIQNRSTDRTYSLGDDFDDFWSIFADVRIGMGFDASSVFVW